jgi:hypothetical protein
VKMPPLVYERIQYLDLYSAITYRIDLLFRATPDDTQKNFFGVDLYLYTCNQADELRAKFPESNITRVTRDSEAGVSPNI